MSTAASHSMLIGLSGNVLNRIFFNLNCVKNSNLYAGLNFFHSFIPEFIIPPLIGMI